jgi:hypothetical protein
MPASSSAAHRSPTSPPPGSAAVMVSTRPSSDASTASWHAASSAWRGRRARRGAARRGAGAWGKQRQGKGMRLVSSSTLV